MMDGKILYFLGAGASAEALPLASKLTESIGDMANSLNQFRPENYQKLSKALKWLSEESSRHASVDTFAKKLYFRRDLNNLKKLKAALSAYLVIEQAARNVDKRYDAFLATILKTDENHLPHIPEEIIIITWNYDIQLEKSFYEFCENDSHVLESITFNHKQIYRVNGYCGSHPPGNIGQSFRAVLKPDRNKIWDAGISLFNEYMADLSVPDADICFAWEDTTRNRLANESLKLHEVSAAVIIGYSFPYFNREVDNFFFLSLSGSKIGRIYLQYPAGTHTTIETRVKGLIKKDVEIVPISATDHFYIPDEWW